MMKKYLPLAIALVVLVPLMPRTAKFNYDYKKGSPWPYETLVSPFDFPILKTEAEMAEERSRSGGAVIPCYRYSAEVVGGSVRGIDGLALGRYSKLKPVLQNSMEQVFSRESFPMPRSRVQACTDRSRKTS